MESTYKTCNSCNQLNGFDNNFCNNCGHKFGNEDLDREFKLGKIEALSKIKNHILGWFSAIGIIIAILGFFSISNIRDAYKSELQAIQKEKQELEKNYSELQVISKDLNSLMGFNDNQMNLSQMIKFLYVNFYSIKDIYVQAKYTYENELNSDYLHLIPFYRVLDFKKNNGTKNFMEFTVTNDNILRLDKNQLLIKYTLFQFFEPALISKKISLLNDMQDIKLRGTSRVKNEYEKDYLINRINANKIKNIELNVYVNSTLFWTLNIKYPRNYENEVITVKTNNYIDFVRQTKYFNFEKEFININEVLNKQFNKVIKQ